MLIIKPKRGGSILKMLSNPFIKAAVHGAVSGAANTFWKRKLNDIVTSNKISRLINGKGIVIE